MIDKKGKQFVYEVFKVSNFKFPAQAMFHKITSVETHPITDQYGTRTLLLRVLVCDAMHSQLKKQINTFRSKLEQQICIY
jgi:hypothetical protein